MKARPETLQPLIIYGNPLTPRTRREMSDLQHYSKLPPIRPDTASFQDVLNGETASEPNQELTCVGDVALDLGDIDVACVTERSVVVLEQGVTDDDRLQIAFTPTDATGTGIAVSMGLEPSPRTGSQNPSLINGVLPTSSCSEEAGEAKPLFNILEEIESPQSEIGDFQTNDAFTRHVNKRRIPFSVPGFNASSGVGVISSDRRVHGRDTNDQKAIVELSEDEDATVDQDVSLDGTQLVENHLSKPADQTEKQQNISKAPKIILTAPSIDIEGAPSLTIEQEHVLKSNSRNNENRKLNDVLTESDDVTLQRKVVISEEDNALSENNDVSKQEKASIKDATVIDDESVSNCDDESVYTTDPLDYDDSDSDVNLLTLEEQEEQRLWDLEFERRKDDLVQEQQAVETRRSNYLSKLNSLTDRWRGIEARLENRQIEKRHQLYEQLQQLVVMHKRN